MLDATTKYLRCVDCNSELTIEPIFYTDETEEGFLNCTSCNSRYPIISKVPLLLKDLPSYFSIRMSLGGQLLLMAKSEQLRNYVKDVLKKVKHTWDDTADLDKRWVGIYRQSTRSKFYSQIRRSIQKLPVCDLVLEHGCSVGYVANHASRRHKTVIGIDKSFYGILEAKKHHTKNSDFIVADSLHPPFGNTKFNLVLALNLLDIIEPNELLSVVLRQADRFLLLSDPYDFERGKGSVNQRITPEELRQKVLDAGFRLIQRTAKPAYIPWKLNVNPRLDLNYKVDMIVGKKVN